MLHLGKKLERLRSVLGSNKWLLVPVAVLAVSMPSAAGAAERGRYDRGEWRDHGRHGHDGPGYGRRDRDRDRGHDRHDHGPKIDVDIRIGGGHRRPEYETRQVRVWVPPVYRTVVDRKWVEPVYRTEVERVWVPDRCEDREVRYRDRGRWCTKIEHVVVEPGHYETVERRVCVSEGRWETCERQELVCAGHYEWRSERVRVPHRVHPFDVVNPMHGRVGVAGL